MGHHKMLLQLEKLLLAVQGIAIPFGGRVESIGSFYPFGTDKPDRRPVFFYNFNGHLHKISRKYIVTGPKKQLVSLFFPLGGGFANFMSACMLNGPCYAV
jgi:hypothetical protein